jgi:hypothetical protein
MPRSQSTYVSVQGWACRAERALQTAIRHLEQAGITSGSLVALAQYIVSRDVDVERTGTSVQGHATSG